MSYRYLVLAQQDNPGLITLEKAMSGAQSVEEAPKRGFDVQLDIRNVGET